MALALALTLRDRSEPAAAGMMLISPVTDPTLSDESITALAAVDPMITQGWLRQGLTWYACPPGTPAHQPLHVDLCGLPPMLIQVGDREVLSDSLRLPTHANACGLPCRLEVHAGRWHDFHLQSAFLRSARAALNTLAEFARRRVSPGYRSQ